VYPVYIYYHQTLGYIITILSYPYSSSYSIISIFSYLFHYIYTHVTIPLYSCILPCVEFAWDAFERGADVHLQADPTKLELLNREYKQRKDTHEDSKKDAILNKYGGVEHLQAPPKELLLAQTVSRTSQLLVNCVLLILSHCYTGFFFCFS